ncbi:MAG: hypothetical protein HYU33_00160, partial [Candidatus Omnitrophica bacterium]|nr:hypothetical protein [Candidatus Omnitrophota bacterium]
TRVGQVTDYDRLNLEIWTNGSMSPKDALLYAANIYQRHLDLFVNYGSLPEEPEDEQPQTIRRAPGKAKNADLGTRAFRSRSQLLARSFYPHHRRINWKNVPGIIEIPQFRKEITGRNRRAPA